MNAGGKNPSEQEAPVPYTRIFLPQGYQRAAGSRGYQRAAGSPIARANCLLSRGTSSLIILDNFSVSCRVALPIESIPTWWVVEGLGFRVRRVALPSGEDTDYRPTIHQVSSGIIINNDTNRTNHPPPVTPDTKH